MTEQEYDETNRFQVNLGGLIDILANHLYSGPQVYLRELLQNATDAIRARKLKEPNHVGAVRVELIATENGPPTLVFEDNGVGLTPDEIELFLATVGQSSKKLVNRDVDYIGRFGIGLLSCFMVCDEIVVITRSLSGNTALKWQGRADGTYSIETLEQKSAVGTRVYIRAKTTAYEYFSPEFVTNTLRRYGQYLGVDTQFESGGQIEQINKTPLWDLFEPNSASAKERVIELASADESFLDVFPIKSEIGGVNGLGFVLATPSTLASQKSHQIYLKRMLLSDTINNILPDWAFFVRVVANIENLQPTASRESLVENFDFEEMREELGRALRQYLVNLAQTDTQRFNAVLSVHHAAIKSLCVEDEECLKLFADWLPFETTIGNVRLGEFRRSHSTIRYIDNVDEFRSVLQVATAQSFPIINAGYVHDADILARLPQVFDELQLEKFELSELAEQFTELTLDEREQVVSFTKLVDSVMQPFKCEAEVVKFDPVDMPTMFVTNDASKFLRNIEQTQESTDATWGAVLEGLTAGVQEAAWSRLFLNFNNPLIQRIVELKDRQRIKTITEVLYVQALLLGHHPLQSAELKILNRGVLDLINGMIVE